MLGDLSKFYESNGDPGCISTGYGDAGGKSYGMYQFSSTMGVVKDFLEWLTVKGYWFANSLSVEPIGSYQFDQTWQYLANSANREDFAKAQHDYVKEKYYDPAVDILKHNYFDVNKHTSVMADVVWSRAVQYGVGNILEMFTTAVHSLGYPNLSYVDDRKFDSEMIVEIYAVCHTEEWTNGSPVLREGLYARFDSECEKALSLLACKPR